MKNFVAQNLGLYTNLNKGNRSLGDKGKKGIFCSCSHFKLRWGWNQVDSRCQQISNLATCNENLQSRYLGLYSNSNEAKGSLGVKGKKVV